MMSVMRAVEHSPNTWTPRRKTENGVTNVMANAGFILVSTLFIVH